MGRAMLSLRFLQFSNLILGERFEQLLPILPPSKIDVLRRESVRVIRDIARTALEREVDAVLCPGGFWEDETVVPEVVSPILDEVAALAPTPVFVAPGTVDPYHRFSLYDAFYFKRKTGRTLPRNFEVFSKPLPERRTVATLPHVDFHGVAVCGSADSAVPMPIVKRPDAVNVAILPWDNCQLPGFDFCACASDAPIPLLRGSALPPPRLRICEVGKGGVLTVEESEVSTRAIHTIDLEIDSGDVEADVLAQRVRQALEDAHVASLDVVVLQLKGTIAPTLAPVNLSAALAPECCFHLEIDDTRLTPDLSVLPGAEGPMAGKRVIGQLAARSKQVLEQLPSDVAVVSRAVFCAFDAVEGREVGANRVF